MQGSARQSKDINGLCALHTAQPTLLAVCHPAAHALHRPVCETISPPACAPWVTLMVGCTTSAPQSQFGSPNVLSLDPTGSLALHLPSSLALCHSRPRSPNHTHIHAQLYTHTLTIPAPSLPAAPSAAAHLVACFTMLGLFVSCCFCCLLVRLLAMFAACRISCLLACMHACFLPDALFACLNALLLA